MKDVTHRHAFQTRVLDWMLECFGPTIAADKVERNHRFLEEALELVQSLGCSEDEALRLVRHVYGRPAGDPPQEVGGVAVTLAALCLANTLDVEDCAETELRRITQPDMVVKIREKQKRKPAMSPLPGTYPEREPPPPAAQNPSPLGCLCVMGEITTADDDGERNHPMALLVEFDSVEDIRAAIQQGECRFQFGEQP